MSKTWAIIALLTAILALPGSVFSEDRGKRGYVPGEILVKFRSDVSKSSRDTAHSARGFKLLKRFRRFQIDHVKVPDGLTVEEAVTGYRLRADVEYAEPNYYRYATAMPNDPSFDDLWGLHNTGQSGGTPDADIDCPEAWDTQTGDPNVVVAVLDSGADLDHEDLSDNIWKNLGEDWVGETPGNDGFDNDNNDRIDDYYGWDFVGWIPGTDPPQYDAKGDNDPDDDHHNSHGTHVAGTIGAVGNNGTGVTGVNWQASLMVLKILDENGDGSVERAISAINYAIDKGAQIINASYSGDNFAQSEWIAIEQARNAGILFVAAAGNDGRDHDLRPVYPSDYDLPNIISVGASDRNDLLASFSNYGATSVDVAAPGVAIYSTMAGNSYDYSQGTSMATPHVSGLAALVWAENPGFTYSGVKDRILNGVDVITGLMGQVRMAGRINANNCINPAADVPPVAPGDVEAEALSGSRIDLSWTDNSSDESGFKIERATLSEGVYRHFMTVGPNVTLYNDTGLYELTTYYYRVSAFNVAGDSNAEEDVATTYLAEPGDLTAAPVSTSQINLTWTDHSDFESGFRIERKLGSRGTYLEIATVGTNVTAYNNMGLEPSTTYYYRINAYGAGDNSEYSNEAHATTSAVSASEGGAGDVSSSNGGGGGCFIRTMACGHD